MLSGYANGVVVKDERQKQIVPLRTPQYLYMYTSFTIEVTVPYWHGNVTNGLVGDCFTPLVLAAYAMQTSGRYRASQAASVSVSGAMG